jgi:AcrR family transcriptional regulator
MSVSSLSTRPARRVPVQNRAERRLESLLEHAAAVIARVGYEAATMTEIASRAKASIGSVYQYFPNKEAIAGALRRKFAADLADRWNSLEADTRDTGSEALASAIIDKFVALANEHPAVFPIMNVTQAVNHDPALKKRLRAQFSSLFVARNPRLSKADADQVAAVTLLTIKSLIILCGEVRAKDRPPVVAEHKVLLAAYLERRIFPAGARPSP